MRYSRLLRAMIAKEVRMTMRERHQLVGLIGGVIALLVMLFFVGRAGMQDLRRRNAARPAPATQITAAPATASGSATAAAQPPAGSPPAHGLSLSRHQIMTIRWAGIGGGAAIGMFFSLGYLMSATLATFAGEKESGTLEILLASPISDTMLFVGKCLSVLLPVSGIGYLFLLFAGILALVMMRELLVQLPVNVALYALVFSVPVMLMPQILLVGLGALISARSDTMKGAGQVLGGVFVIVFFGLFYGVPLLISQTPLRRPALAFGRAWLEMPFALQYVLALAILAVPATFFLLLGRAAIRRDRLLR